jgi:hypothetical protein
MCAVLRLRGAIAERGGDCALATGAATHATGSPSAAQKCIKSRRRGSPGWNWPWMIVARASERTHAVKYCQANCNSGYKLVGAGILGELQDELERPHFSLDFAVKRPDLALTWWICQRLKLNTQFRTIHQIIMFCGIAELLLYVRIHLYTMLYNFKRGW